MSTAYQIPLQVGVPQTFSVTLSGVTYRMTFLYRNDPNAGWTLDIADSGGNALIQGIPLVTGADLLAQYKHIIPSGMLVVQTTNDPDAAPTFQNLGKDSQVYWVVP